LPIYSTQTALQPGYLFPCWVAGKPQSYIGRLTSDGNREDSFEPQPSREIDSLVLEPFGKILVGGYFTMLGGQPRKFIGRLNSNGSLDDDVNPVFNPSANSYVYSLAVQPDGKILVGGDFTTLTGQPRKYMAQLNSDGSLDTSFNPGADNDVLSLVVQRDGKVLVGGIFTTL